MNQAKFKKERDQLAALIVYSERVAAANARQKAFEMLCLARDLTLKQAKALLDEVKRQARAQ